MTNKLVRKVTKTYIAGTPSVPPTPARCYTRTTQRVSSSGGSVGGTSSTFIPISEIESGSGYNGFIVPVYGPGTSDGLSPSSREIVGYNVLRFSPDPVSQPSYTSTTETICEPAVPGVEGTPAQVVLQNEGPDWRASARSVKSMAGDVTASFNVNPKPRMIVGFARRDSGSSQADIRMGVAFVQAGATSQVLPVIDGVTQVQVANYTAGDRVALSRIRGRFYIQLGGDVVYSAAATTEDDVFLDAMLYTSADYVDDPQLAESSSTVLSGRTGLTAGLSTQVAILARTGFDVLASGRVDGVVLVQVRGRSGFGGAVTAVDSQRVSVSGTAGFSGATRSGVVSSLSLPTYQGAENSDLNAVAVVLGPLYFRGSDKPYAAVSTTLGPITVEATGGQLSQSVAGGDLVLAPMLTLGTMLTGGLAQVEVELKPLTMFAADRDYAEGRTTLPRLLVYGDDGFGQDNYYGHNDSLAMRDTIFTDPSLFASMYETLELSTEMSLAVLVSDSVLEGLILDPSLSAKDFLSALIESGINLSSATQMPDPRVAQYAFNALNGAATRYSDFGFTQFARSRGVTYAIKPDGLYRLRRGDDNGAQRSALVDFGTMAFGVQQRKNIETMYLGMSTDGTVYAKLQGDNGEEKTYRVIQREPTMRVRTGKGITAREWNLKLEVIDATRVDLDNVDFAVGASLRRWTR